MNLSVPFLDMKGEPVTKGEGKCQHCSKHCGHSEEKDEPVPLSQIIANCLASGTGTAEEKLNYFSLALTIQNSGEDIDLTLAERTMIKDVVGKNGTVLTVGRVWEAFEDKE